jgi:glycosyltransferase involved in cell wall biosynthesis
MYEVIVVDDGSTDETEKVVRSFGNEKVRYYKKENGERGAARNYGARLATGDYVNFFDSDDLAYPNHLMKANETIDNLLRPEVFHLDYDVKDAVGNFLQRGHQWRGKINDRLIDGNHLSCNGVFLRRDICLLYPFNEKRALSASEDYELWLRLASRFPFEYVNIVTSTVVNHDSRSVINIEPEKFLVRIGILQNELLKDDGFMKFYGSRVRIFQSYLNIYIALHLAMANHPRKASLGFLIHALRKYPQVIFSYRFLAALKNITL